MQLFEEIQELVHELGRNKNREQRARTIAKVEQGEVSVDRVSGWAEFLCAVRRWRLNQIEKQYDQFSELGSEENRVGIRLAPGANGFQGWEWDQGLEDGVSRIPIRLSAPRSKYRAIRTDGYASKKEAKRAADLELLEKLGKIRELYKQPRFQLLKGDGSRTDRGIWYAADFSYWDIEKQERIVEDVKGGCKTPVYRLKKKLMWAIHGIRIQEV